MCARTHTHTHTHTHTPGLTEFLLVPHQDLEVMLCGIFVMFMSVKQSLEKCLHTAQRVCFCLQSSRSFLVSDFSLTTQFSWWIPQFNIVTCDTTKSNITTHQWVCVCAHECAHVCMCACMWVCARLCLRVSVCVWETNSTTMLKTKCTSSSSPTSRSFNQFALSRCVGL